MKKTLVLLAAVMSAAVSIAADRPTIYNFVDNQHTELDSLIKSALSSKFTIVDILDPKGSVQPKPTAGNLPHTAWTSTGESLGGYVLVGYVITAEGRAAEPVILKTTNERVNDMALKAMYGWRFTPATLNGVPIAITAAQEFTFETAPTEFVTQTLEPTGGKISRPKDWFYTEGHRGPVYMWTISRENTAGNHPYTTGVRIQTFTDIKNGTGKTAKQFILDFMASKKKEASKIIKACDEKDQGLFTRVCLEMEVGSYHILYSLFWSSSGQDLAVVVIAGTRKELWETYAPTFDKMSAFDLIDMNRFEGAK